MRGTKSHPFLRLIRERVSVERFDPERELSEAQIRELVQDAIEAPSSFNIQHWRFVAVRHEADKRLLMAAAYGQEQVLEAAVTFIVLGDLLGVEQLPEVLEQAVRDDALPAGKAQAWIRMAREIYADEQMARDEALRSGSLAAMVLMLSAQARGLAAGALSGFDPVRVLRDFEIDSRFVPVMLVAVGHAASTTETRKPRLPVERVLAFDRGRSLTEP